MTLKRVLVLIVVLLVPVAYVAGCWPERTRADAAAAATEELRASLTASAARVRLGEILGLLLRLEDAVAVNNFGEAAGLSSAYFDRVRQEAPAQPAEAGAALERSLAARDAVTAAIARADPSVAAPLREQEQQLRRALGYPVADSPAQ
jgi:hypothetical protein